MSPRVHHILELARDLSTDERDEMLGELAARTLEGDPEWVAAMDQRAREARAGNRVGASVDDALEVLEAKYARTSA